ncbi:MAG: DEAD/DEAH box helicase [Dissulfurispiraceae bacterium]
MLKFLSNMFQGLPTKQEDTRKTHHIPADYACQPDEEVFYETLRVAQQFFKEHYNPNVSSVLVSAPGTGKTTIALIATRPILDKGEISVALAPTREAVNTLVKELEKTLGRKLVGRYAGKDKDAENKYVIATTPEGFLSAVRGKKDWTRTTLIIPDECDLINSSESYDAAVTVAMDNGAKALLMSGTVRNPEEIAEFFNADLYISEAKRDITVEEIIVLDDLDAVDSIKATTKEGMIVTLDGYAYNPKSARLQKLREVLARNEGERIIVFVPTKKYGYCLSQALGVPFHCADLDTSDRQFLLEEFDRGTLPVICATETLARAVNSKCTLPIVFGTRSGSFYKSSETVEQEFGRTDRKKMNGRAVILADRMELYRLKTDVPDPAQLPVEPIVLTYLCLQPQTENFLVERLAKTFAARTSEEQKIRSKVSDYISKLRNLSLVENVGRSICLNAEGLLVSRYCLKPDDYDLFKKMAERLSVMTLDPRDKGCLLMAICLNSDYRIRWKRNRESALSTAVAQMELADEYDYRRIRRATIFRQIMAEAALAPSNMHYSMNDAGRWVSLLKEANEQKLFPNADIFKPFRDSLNMLLSIAKSAKEKAEKKNDPSEKKPKVKKTVQPGSSELKQQEIFITS